MINHLFLNLPRAAGAEAHSSKVVAIYELKSFPKVNEKGNAEENFLVRKRKIAEKLLG